MTVEELKSIAESMGYYIQKKPGRKGRLLPCTCGRKCPNYIRSGHYGGYVKCCTCGKTGPYIDGSDISSPYNTLHEVEVAARLAWNEMIASERDDIPMECIK